MDSYKINWERAGWSAWPILTISGAMVDPAIPIDLFVKVKISLDEAEQILRDKSMEVTCEPLIRPKSHQAFLFSADDQPLKKNNWRCDQYRWFNGGVTKLPRHKPVLKKHYFYVDLEEGHLKEFQRHAYQLIGNELVTLVHYVGDETKAIDFNHGKKVPVNHLCVRAHQHLKD